MINKIKEIVEKGLDKGLDSDTQDSINLIKILSDDFTNTDSDAAALAEQIIVRFPYLLQSAGRMERSDDVAILIDQTEIEPQEIEPEDTESMFFGDKFFQDNPEKILGKIEIGKDRYGKEIKQIKGDISDIKKIEVPEFSSAAQTTNSIISVIESDPEEKTHAPEQKEFIKSVIQKSGTELNLKTLSRKKKKEEITEELPSGPPKYDLQSFDEVFKEYNPGISQEQLQVFLWYKQKIGQPLSSKWYELANTSMAMLNNDNPVDWVKKGFLYYYNGDLLPAYLYLAEYVYVKMQRLVKTADNSANSGQDKKYIIDTYGQETFDNQLAALKLSYDNIYQNRLLIKTAGSEDGLVLIATSKFAREFKINSLSDEMPFEIKKVTAAMSKDYGKPDFLHRNAFERKSKTEFSELSLTDAFSYWILRDKGSIDLRKNISIEDIVKYYIFGSPKPRKPNDQISDADWEAQTQRLLSNAKSEGDRLFAVFLDTQLLPNDKIRLELEWNSKYNGYVPIDYNKVPVAFNLSKTIRDEKLDIRPEKREAVAFVFSEGSGCLAYDVGVGKTISAIFTIEQFIEAGYCKRPFLVVPNQTYRQWIAEIKSVLPQRLINDMYNLRGEYYEQLLDENQQVMKVEEGSLSIMTYEGLERLGFNEITEGNIMVELYEILNQGGEEEHTKSEKKKASFQQRLETIIGKGLKGSMINIEDLGFDFFCSDEAHAAKKVFTTVKGEQTEEKGKRERTQYKIQSGSPSSTALKAFMMAQYIQRNNHGRNVLLLTATPFTNSPLEIFSMLSLIAYNRMAETDINNLNSFFDNYISATTELTINAKLKPQYRQIIKGFHNLQALQQLIRRFFNYKTGEDVGVIRPNKIVIPLQKKMVDGNIIDLKEGEKIDSFVLFTPLQASLMDKIRLYAEGKISEGELVSNSISIDFEVESGEDDLVDTEAVEIEESSLSDKEKSGVRILKSMNHGRNLALSPYLYEHSGLGKPTYLQYVEESPKIKYTMECIKSVREYHLQNKEEISGQIIYMDRGIEYFGLLKEYLVKEIGYEAHEVGMIFSQMPGGKNAKENVKNAFNGFVYNEKTKSFENLPDNERIKVLIGSSTIKEGMNLQRKTTVLYNLFLDWNPTDFVQLCGRAWRQGNEFLNVRVVCPVMIDSIDIFMLQKLEEKTARINTIWSSDGRVSVLKLEEVNPSELKSSLIKDPKILAELSVEEDTVKLRDDISAENSFISRIEAVKGYLSEIESNEQDLRDEVAIYRPSKKDKPLSELVKVYQEIIRTQKDEKGRVMVYRYERDDKIRKLGSDKVSDLDPVYEKYWFKSLMMAVRGLNRDQRDFLGPKNIDIKNLDRYILQANDNIKSYEEQIKYLTGDQYISQKTQEIIEERERKAIRPKQIPELVNEFRTLNHLLSVKRSKEHIKKVEADIWCELYNDAGERRIDAEAIEHLENCLNQMPQTKSLHTNEAGEYTDERKKLHASIVEKLRAGKECMVNSEPIAILTGGSPGSGKTTFLKKYAPYLLSDSIYKIDADGVREFLPEYKGWNATATHSETKDVVDYLLSDQNIGVPCKYDLIYDGTMNKAKNYLPLIGTLKRLGYKVFVIYLTGIPYEEIVKRTRERYKKGGRYVPMEVINDFFERGEKALNELKTKVDGYLVVDAKTYDYKIIEEGGMKLPESRPYSKLSKQDSLDNIPEPEPVKSNKTIIQQKVKGFETLLRITKDKEKKSVIQKKLNGFKILLKIAK